MANTSATGGVLTPSAPGPAADAGLDALFQPVFAAILGFDGSLVRPRWQPVPPKQLAASIDWCALSVNVLSPNDGPAIVHDGTANGGLGADTYSRHETLDLFVSIYGPNSGGNAALLRDGLSVPQNTEALLPAGIRWVECSPARAIPELVNQQWIRRYDLSIIFRRMATRVYGVENLAGSVIDLIDDTTINDTIAVPPP